MEEPATKGDGNDWIQRALACVTCDGAADARTLVAIEFEHDLALARRIIASLRASGYADDVVLSGIHVPKPHKPDKLSRLVVVESRLGSSVWRAYASLDVQRRTHVLGTGTRPLDDGVVAVLLALSIRSRATSALSMTAYNLVNGAGDTWLLCAGRALALRSAPWDMSAIDQEVGLARLLIDAMETQYNDCTGPVVPRLADEQMSAADASAYRSAIALWDRHGLLLRAPDASLIIRANTVQYGLRVFVTAAERMQATPGIYLACVAPAIAARLQPALDALDRGSDQRDYGPK